MAKRKSVQPTPTPPATARDPSAGLLRRLWLETCGTAPLRRLFGFSTSLRSATQGRAGLVLTFDRFDLP